MCTLISDSAESESESVIYISRRIQMHFLIFFPGEPVSVSVDSNDSTLGLSQLSPGSTYEISVISVLGLDESDPIGDLVMTREQ